MAKGGGGREGASAALALPAFLGYAHNLHLQATGNFCFESWQAFHSISKMVTDAAERSAAGEKRETNQILALKKQLNES